MLNDQRVLIARRVINPTGRAPVTTLPDRPNTALVVIDMQHGVISEAFEVERVVANINALVVKARSEDVPVIWVQHSDEDMPYGSDGWEQIPDLPWVDGEDVVQKHHGDSFEDTNLESILADRLVGRLVVTGAQTDACVRSTLHGALVRGYDTTLVEDAHTTEDLRPWGSPISPGQSIAYANMYWGFSGAPGRVAGTAATADIEFGPADAEPGSAES